MRCPRDLATVALLAAVAVCAALTGCQSASSPASGSDGGQAGPARVEVECDVYSGRPNPTWTLSGAQATAFLHRLSALSSRPSGTSTDPLGYRGFVVRWLADGRPRVATVRAGLVTLAAADGAEGTGYRSDPERGLERWLLASGRERLDPVTRTGVEAALGE